MWVAIYNGHGLHYGDLDCLTNGHLCLGVTPTTLFRRLRDGGTLTTLDTHTSTFAEEVWYSARTVLASRCVSVPALEGQRRLAQVRVWHADNGTDPHVNVCPPRRNS